MPTYEYECNSCRVRFERRQRMSADPVETCPECGGSVHRILFPVGIVFKGSGFYSTDNRRNGGNSGYEKSTPSEAKSEDKSSPSEAKKEDKSEAAASVSGPTKE